ncbi:tRNA pseudouridine(55) synthase TruB [Sporanaerobium hydrogeniformans]|uniref:tRNA pseudouridine(55) synthase TruB n=1 Tax=Sporanaerobium hydrogeniformans TaxID=3072179 RepID=A0AC61DF13_9FIRM|nr:tRNA pseudouridine(55) synthase TruB [Sporanaerobium hydrogeniformans]PHV71784.1 tRNA pseudouridine(55) synthase TruB [Sporanaerobium hydrogeniformans]
MLNGIINIYKEKGYTSHDVVAKARRILSERKIGHTGTLDPEAEGVLPICIGKATGVVPYLTDADKCYEAEVILGAYTTTEDATGEVIERFEVATTKEQISEVIKSFEGSYIQTPPMYSAIKVNGVRLYELARQGLVVDRPSREVKIYSCEMIEWLSELRFKIRVCCSKGTYIRTLCTDIGRKLGCGAYMGELLRTQVGTFLVEDSVTLDVLESHREEVQSYLYPFEEIFKDYKVVTVKENGIKLLQNGNKLQFKYLEEVGAWNEGELIRVHTPKGDFIALYKVNKTQKILQVEKMFL